MTKKTNPKKNQTAFKVVFLLSFAVLVLMGMFALGTYKESHLDKKPSHVAVEIPAEQASQPFMSSEDALGDFIMHHEYFAADQDVLEPDQNLVLGQNSEPEMLPEIQGEDVNRAAAEDKTQEIALPENSPTEISAESQAEKKSRVILEKISVEKPLIAIVIDDMGINRKRTKDIITLEAPLTSSFLTYGNNLAEFAADAKKAGHEIMIHAPMEPKVKANLAPDTLMVSMDKAEIEKNFESMLEKFNHIPVDGINNHMGSRYTEDKEKLGVVMGILQQHQMFFLDSKTTASSKGKELAEEDGVDYAARDVFLDNENDYAYITAQLGVAEKLAARKGFAIAICHPKSQTFLALKDWLKTLDGKNVKLVHVREIVDAINQE